MTTQRDDGVCAILGPTNTGKTHQAIERMLRHDSGMIGLPLRLLAREVYDRVREKTSDAAVALITGEEKIVPKRPAYWVCTVEAMPVDKPVAFVAVDEIQLIGDPERGHIFTSRLLHARGRVETVFMGSSTVRPLLEALIPGVRVETKERFSTLEHAGQKKVSRLPRRSAIVAFSAERVYAAAELIRRQRGGAAIVMGALSPRTRNAQADMFESGEVDFLVATDAIGMGLNMNVSHVAFAGLSKFDGRAVRRLTPAESGQIAGRAGRYTADGTFGATADCPGIEDELVERIVEHRFDPLPYAFWRTGALDFSTPRALIRSLEQKPEHKALRRAPPQTDLLALKRMVRDEAVSTRLGSQAHLRLLWDVCQIPDFPKNGGEEHAHFLVQVFRHLSEDQGKLPEDWVSSSLTHLARFDGDVDTLAGRLAHVRTWNYVTHRSGWVDQGAEWQARARTLEDQLSDALHNRLAKRFVDRRTSALIRGLRDRSELSARIANDGSVHVEGHKVGHLEGLTFKPEAAATGDERRAMMNAARKALGPELSRRVDTIAKAPEKSFKLNEAGELVWNGAVLGVLSELEPDLRVRIRLLDNDLLQDVDRSKLSARLREVAESIVRNRLPGFHGLGIGMQTWSANARALAFQVLEQFGFMVRSEATDALLKALGSEERKALRSAGLRIGTSAVFVPDIVKPQARSLLARMTNAPRGLATEVSGAMTSVRADSLSDGEPPFAFQKLGPLLVRCDIVERVDGLMRKGFRAGEKGQAQAADQRIISLLGASHGDVADVLKALGYRCVEAQPAAAAEDGQSAAVDGSTPNSTPGYLWRPPKRRALMPRKSKTARPSKAVAATTGQPSPTRKRKPVSQHTKPKKPAPNPRSPFAALAEWQSS